MSYRALSRYSSKKSDATIAKALQRLKQIEIIEKLPKARNNFRDPGRYRFTLDSPKFQAALSEIYARLKLERDNEREMRAQSLGLRPTPRTTPLTQHHTQVLLPAGRESGCGRNAARCCCPSGNCGVFA